MNHTFTTFSPQIIIPITTPFNISFTLTPPPDFRPTPGVATRLLHVRTHEGKPKLTEIFELKVSGNGQLVCELSGYGNKQVQFRTPMKLDIPEDGDYIVRYNNGIVTVNGNATSTHLAITDDVPVELCFGFNKSNDELVAPFGWVLETNLGTGTGTITPTQPPVNPPVTTQPPLVTVPPVITPPPTTTTPTIPTPSNPSILPNPHPTITPEDQIKKELIQDLMTLATKYAMRQGIDPQVILLIQLLITMVRK